MPSLPPWDSYAIQLYQYTNGLPLYDPDPAGTYDKVRVGDVGYVLKGKFTRLFNVFERADSAVNAGGVPENFVPVASSFTCITRRNVIPACIMHFGNIEVGLARFRSDPDADHSSTDEAASRSRLNDAALVIKRNAFRQDAVCESALQEYLIENYSYWRAFARDKLGPIDASLSENILLVTGCDLTQEWAIVEFDDAATSGETYSFRQGPVPWTLSPLSRAAVKYDYHDDAACPYNQCIFLRTMRVKERRIDTFGVAAVNDAVPDKGSSSATDLEVHELGFHDAIANYIFENKPTVELAIVYDGDVISRLDQLACGSLGPIVDQDKEFDVFVHDSKLVGQLRDYFSRDSERFAHGVVFAA